MMSDTEVSTDKKLATGQTEPIREQRSPRNVTAVGGIVVSGDGILLVRMTYGPTKGRYMLPGGIVDPGETLDDAVVREVREETSVETRVIGICGVRTRYDGSNNDTYVMFLLEPVSGEPTSDDVENDDARYFSLPELDGDDVVALSAYMGRLALQGELHIQQHADDFNTAGAGRNPKAWKLFR